MLIARSSPPGSRPSLSAACLLLDRTDVIDIGFDYMLPAIFAAVGLVLLAAGLSE